MLVHRRVTPSITFTGTHLYTWVREALSGLSVLSKNTTQCSQPGLEPGGERTTMIYKLALHTLCLFGSFFKGDLASSWPKALNSLCAHLRSRAFHECMHDLVTNIFYALFFSCMYWLFDSMDDTRNQITFAVRFSFSSIEMGSLFKRR